MEVERTMSGQLQSLKLQLQQKGGHSRQQDEELISAMREQVTTVWWGGEGGRGGSGKRGRNASHSEIILHLQGQNDPDALRRSLIFPFGGVGASRWLNLHSRVPLQLQVNLQLAQNVLHHAHGELNTAR